MYRIVIIMMLFIGLTSCSSVQNLNQESEGITVLKGGVIADKSWTESLEFKKTTWYSETTVTYETMITKLSSDSPFVSWVGESGKSTYNSCSNVYLSFLYANSVREKSRAYLKDQIEKNGMKEITLPEFKRNILSHSLAPQLRLKDYQFAVFCSDTDKGKELAVSLPGHRKISIL